MKYIPYGLFACIVLSGLSIDAMNDQCMKWTEKINTIADQMPKLAEDILQVLNRDVFEVPDKLRTIGTELKDISFEMLAKYKIPVIEEDILKKTTNLFEYEIKWLRPESRDQAGKDRIYIQDLLKKLFRNNNRCNWRQMAEKDVPYIPNLIDTMLANRTLSESTQITLDRAKRVSEFDQRGLESKIIITCLKSHLAGVPDHLSQQITETIQHQRGSRYYAIQAVSQWADDQNDEDDEGQEEQEQNNRSSKRMRKTKIKNNDE